MKLHVSLGSPYARLARIAVQEKGLAHRVEVIFTITREVGSPCLVDGLSVWGRQMARPESERSPGLIDHERERAGHDKLTAWFDAIAARPSFVATAPPPRTPHAV